MPFRNIQRNEAVNAQIESKVKNVLTARRVSVVYQTRRGPVKALEDLDLSVGQRSFVAIVGPSGCAKTTMLKLFSGLLQPTSGDVQINGATVSGPRPEVGVVFQHPTLMPWKSVLSNVLMPAKILGLDKARSRERAHELLKLVGLEQFAENYPRELSGGMQQRVGLARALIHDPEVLLMDEPFAALDAITREHMALELQSLWLKTGKSVLFITHNISEAVFLADKVIVL